MEILDPQTAHEEIFRAPEVTLDELVLKMNHQVEKAKRYGSDIIAVTSSLADLQSQFSQLKKSPTDKDSENKVYNDFRTLWARREEANISEKFIYQELNDISSQLKQIGVSLILGDDKKFSIDYEHTHLGKDFFKEVYEIKRRLKGIDEKVSTQVMQNQAEIRQKVFLAAQNISGETPFDVWQKIYDKRDAPEVTAVKTEIKALLAKKGWALQEAPKKRTDGDIKLTEMRFNLLTDDEDRTLLIEIIGHPPRYTLNFASGPISKNGYTKNGRTPLTREELFDVLNKLK